MERMQGFLAGMPKAELHLHIEGTIPPRMVLELAARNGIDIPYASEAELLAAQDYGQPALDNFLRYHYVCTSVLRTGRDVAELADDFFRTCRRENIRHVELSFDPQQHLDRGIAFGELIEALDGARRRAEAADGISSVLIMCMNRERSAESAMEMLDLAEGYRDRIAGVGLDSFETGNPPVKFRDFYRRAAAEGYRLTAHCDCNIENSVQHIHQCIHDLGVERIDHGLHCLDDEALYRAIRERGIALTMCPTWRPSDTEPRRLEGLRRMLDLDLLVSINTDDPEEFASRYLTNTLAGVARAGGFSQAEMVRFMRNAFVTAWAPEDRKAALLEEFDAYVAAHARRG